MRPIGLPFTITLDDPSLRTDPCGFGFFGGFAWTA